MPTATIGRIVHYVSHGTPVHADGSQAFTSECRAAIVTAVGEDHDVDLAVLNPTGMFFNQAVEYHEPQNDPRECGHPGGTWHWPERD